MADEIDYSKLSDEDLEGLTLGTPEAMKKFSTGPALIKAVARPFAAEKPTTAAEEIEPNPLKRAAAAAGAAVLEPIEGAVEKARLMFPPQDRLKADAERRDLAAERAQRRKYERQLRDTSAGAFGDFAGRALMTVPFSTSVPGATIGMGALGFLGGGPDKPTGLGNELASSLLNGAEDAAGTYVGTKLANLAGKTANAAMGRYSPRGRAALDLDEAGMRMGLTGDNRLTLGQLDPMGPAGRMEQGMPSYGSRVRDQAEIIRKGLTTTRQVPNPNGRGTLTEEVPGGALRQDVTDAINVRRQQARGMYSAVDAFAQANGLAPVDPNYTLRVLSQINKQLTASGKSPTGNNLAFNLLDHYDPDAFNWLKSAGSTAKARLSGMSMGEYHDARVAVGRALNAIERKPPANLTADDTTAMKLLKDLKDALDSDVERWATANSGNKEAMEMYKRAKDFYATTGADVLNNPLSRKMVSRTRGFQSPEQMYNAVINPTNQSLTDRWVPTLNRRGKDALRVLQDVPDLGTAVATGKYPEAADLTHSVVRAGLSATGHPTLALAEYVPGLHWATTRSLPKRLYFAQSPMEASPLARATTAAGGQYPAGAVEDWTRERLSNRR